MKEYDEEINKEDDKINEDWEGGYKEESIEPGRRNRIKYKNPIIIEYIIRF